MRTHGKQTTYSKGCRCLLCTVANREHQQERRRRAGMRAINEYNAERRASIQHGTVMMYKYGCRCDDCMEWMRADRRRFRVNGSAVTCSECGAVCSGERGLAVHHGKMHASDDKVRAAADDGGGDE